MGDCKTWEVRCALSDHADSGIVRCKWLNTLAYSNFLCTCSTDNTLRLFDALAGRCEKVLRGHTDQVVDLDVAIIAGNGCNHLRILSGSDDKSCKIFQMPPRIKGHESRIRLVNDCRHMSDKASDLIFSYDA